MSLNEFLFRCKGKCVMVRIIGAIVVIFPIKCMDYIESDTKIAFGEENSEDYDFDVWYSTIEEFEIIKDDLGNVEMCSIKIQDNGYTTLLEVSIDN